AGDGGGQVCDADSGAVTGEHGGFDGVGELADVAGPRVRLEASEGCGRERARGRLVALGEVVEEVVGEERDIAVAVAERGQAAGEDEQAMVEVSAEPAFGDGALEVDAGGG